MALAVLDVAIGVTAYGVERVVHYGGMAVRRKATRKKGEPPLAHPSASVLRSEACGKGAYLPGVTDQALSNVLRRFKGDVDLAADALAMKPPPVWIEELISP